MVGGWVSASGNGYRSGVAGSVSVSGFFGEGSAPGPGRGFFGARVYRRRGSFVEGASTGGDRGGSWGSGSGFAGKGCGLESVGGVGEEEESGVWSDWDGRSCRIGEGGFESGGVGG